jgi:hypothetical protein
MCRPDRAFRCAALLAVFSLTASMVGMEAALLVKEGLLSLADYAAAAQQLAQRLDAAAATIEALRVSSPDPQVLASDWLTRSCATQSKRQYVCMPTSAMDCGTSSNGSRAARCGVPSPFSRQGSELASLLTELAAGRVLMAQRDASKWSAALQAIAGELGITDG